MGFLLRLPTSVDWKFWTGCAIALTASFVANAQDRNDPQAYLGRALDLMQAQSLHRNQVDWASVRLTAETKARGALTPRDTYPAIRTALGMLGDHHSFLQPSTTDVKPTAQTLNAKQPMPRGEMRGRVAYVWIPHRVEQHWKINSEFCDKLQAILTELDALSPIGWIVDLRDNDGGNMWPMLAGIGPLLGEGEVGSFDYGSDSLSWWYRDGAAGCGVATICRTTDINYRLRQPIPKVAVLIGPRTASSGEAIAVAFSARPNTRSFGLPTAGLSTGNATLQLSDGAVMYLTTSVYADRSGRQYGGTLTPDLEVPATNPSPKPALPASDTTIDAAVAWLETGG